VTYGIIEKHGGHIEAHSNKGRGTMFTIVLPLGQKKPAVTTSL